MAACSLVAINVAHKHCFICRLILGSWLWCLVASRSRCTSWHICNTVVIKLETLVQFHAIHINFLRWHSSGLTVQCSLSKNPPFKTFLYSHCKLWNRVTGCLKNTVSSRGAWNISRHHSKHIQICQRHIAPTQQKQENYYGKMHQAS